MYTYTTNVKLKLLSNWAEKSLLSIWIRLVKKNKNIVKEYELGIIDLLTVFIIL